jgi:hypothetical protein
VIPLGYGGTVNEVLRPTDPDPPMRHSRKFPQVFKIESNTRIVQLNLGNDTMAVKVNEPVGGEQGYVIFTTKGVSLGELLTFGEITERQTLIEN